MKKIFTTAIALTFLAACQGQNGASAPILSQSDVGAVVGGAAGAWIGSNVGSGSGATVATATGTLLGATLGRTVGQVLAGGDLAYYDKASQEAMTKGQPGQLFPWQSPYSTAAGTVTPGSYYQNNSGQYCREYTQTINVGGRIEEGYGVACRQNDGTWKIKS